MVCISWPRYLQQLFFPYFNATWLMETWTQVEVVLFHLLHQPRLAKPNDFMTKEACLHLNPYSVTSFSLPKPRVLHSSAWSRRIWHPLEEKQRRRPLIHFPSQQQGLIRSQLQSLWRKLWQLPSKGTSGLYPRTASRLCRAGKLEGLSKWMTASHLF